MEDSVEGIEQDAAQAGFFAAGAAAGDDLETGAPLGKELRDQLGRVLEIGVEEDGGVALGKFEAGAVGGHEAEITAEVEDAPAREGGEFAGDDLAGAIGAAVIDDNQFVFDAGFLEGGGEPGEELAETV